MVKWLLQEVGKTQMLEDNFFTVKKLNFHYQGFSFIGDKNEVINLENICENLEDNYIIRGGTKIISLIFANQSILNLSNELTDFQKENHQIFFNKLKNGFFYDIEKFDQSYYNKLDLPLLNKDSFFVKAKDVLNQFFDKEYFIKPSKDLKAFLPGILIKGQTVENFILNSSHIKNFQDELLLFSSVKEILSEYRFFIVNNEVVTGSQYKKNDKVIYSNIIPQRILDCAKEYAKLYNPHDIFTMDLADTKDGIKIVEYNCWNGSGLYHCDKLKLFRSVNDFIEVK